MADNSYLSNVINQLSGLNRLTVMRACLETPPFLAMSKMLNSILRGKLFDAEMYYHEMTYSLMESKARRVSGNLFVDYILYIILEVPNSFSVAAAQGFIDTPVYAAMREDLAILLTAAKMNSADVQRWLELASGERTDRTNDRIATMASAALGGVSHNVPPRETPKSESAIPAKYAAFSCLSWDYGEFELRDNYVSDSALEEIYMRCLAKDRSGLIDDLWNFFYSYGTGDFLKYNVFEFVSKDSDYRLVPYNRSIISYEDAAECLYEEQRNQLINNTIAFMRDDEVKNTLITGASGMGKTTMVFALLHELQEVRLVKISGRDVRAIFKLSNLAEALSKQPLKFVLLVDDCDSNIPEIERQLKKSLPQNILVYCTAVEQKISHVFQSYINLENLSVANFARFIHKKLTETGRDFDLSEITSAIMDYQLETHLPFTYYAAKQVLREFQNR
ncbi:MAG: DUF815 domain-containing protein [Clostridiales bacterium]|nr:DUF815 domain-containing protein [Clostridiales bacterium]